MLSEIARALGIAVGRISRPVRACRGSTRVANSGHRLSGLGATEDQVNLAATVPERIDRAGTKVEDLAGTGVHDSQGG